MPNRKADLYYPGLEIETVLSGINQLFSKSVVVVIEEAKNQDIPSLADIHDRSFPKGWNESEFVSLLNTPGTSCLVARRKGKPDLSSLAFVIVRQTSSEAEIITIATEPNNRSNGIARLLMENLMRKLQADRARSLFLEVEENNIYAVNLYKSLGFKKVGERKGYYTSTKIPQGKPSTALVMQCELG